MISTAPEVCVGAIAVDDGRLLLVRRGRGHLSNGVKVANNSSTNAC